MSCDAIYFWEYGFSWVGKTWKAAVESSPDDYVYLPKWQPPEQYLSLIWAPKLVDVRARLPNIFCVFLFFQISIAKSSNFLIWDPRLWWHNTQESNMVGRQNPCFFDHLIGDIKTKDKGRSLIGLMFSSSWNTLLKMRLVIIENTYLPRDSTLDLPPK